MTKCELCFEADRENNEVKAVDGDGDNVIGPMAIPEYGLDYKKIIADEMMNEYKNNGINDKVLKLFYTAIAETWSVE